jgi:hypothetical protein
VKLQVKVLDRPSLAAHSFSDFPHKQVFHLHRFNSLHPYSQTRKKFTEKHQSQHATGEIKKKRNQAVR